MTCGIHGFEFSTHYSLVIENLSFDGNRKRNGKNFPKKK
ncbi:hypothetical protein LEP1GSC193_1002 [Leptospira alstonii serovar Pingchang str. 80-412]|uniref:Uncharacterized protein n=1 Tax=Leptospira alstonii serovar Pingchang str. 80-412 TaxID=1218564 RepID=T0HFA9_9LEPT|nr:hypothetical protein LEP1GSC193_1002 [Leptospira alstonii serovar Pingchang str. 80-412]